jgi:O-antigen/teichoic acid export membrane protein
VGCDWTLAGEGSHVAGQMCIPKGLRSGAGVRSSDGGSIMTSTAQAITSRWPVCLYWGPRIALAVLDQGLISGTNFALSILLARWVTPEQYGAYALCFSAYLLLSSAHQAVLLEPMSVLGPVEYVNNRRKYIGVLLYMQLAWGIVSGGVLAVMGSIAKLDARTADFGDALLGLAVGAPLILLASLLRSACYLNLNSRSAAKAAFFYATIILSAIAIEHSYGSVSTQRVFVIMGGASLLVSVYLAFVLTPALPDRRDRAFVAGVLARHWGYGRWAVGTCGVMWVWENTSYILTGVLLGARDVGGLKAVGNLILPLAHTTAACGRLAQPYISRLSGQSAHSTAAPAWTVGLMMSAGAVVYCGVVSVFSVPIFHYLYRDNFVEYARLFPWIGINFVLGVLSHNGLGIGLRALQSPSSVFTAFSVGAVAAVALGFPAGRAFGIEGMIGASIAASVVTLLLSAQFFHRELRKSALHMALQED